MKIEKFVISFIAVAIGILVAGIAFYLYQTTKVVSISETKTVSVSPAQTTPSVSSSSLFLTLDTPKDEEVVNIKTVTIAGKTVKDAVIIISTANSDQVITPAISGSFSTTAVLDNGTNNIEITTIGKNGEEVTIVRTVTFSTETF